MTHLSLLRHPICCVPARCGKFPMTSAQLLRRFPEGRCRGGNELRAVTAFAKMHDKSQCQAERVGNAGRTGRGGGTRTPDRRIWNPVLYQLSYTPRPRHRICHRPGGIKSRSRPRPNSALAHQTPPRKAGKPVLAVIGRGGDERDTIGDPAEPAKGAGFGAAGKRACRAAIWPAKAQNPLTSPVSC